MVIYRPCSAESGDFVVSDVTHNAAIYNSASQEGRIDVSPGAIEVGGSVNISGHLVDKDAGNIGIPGKQVRIFVNEYGSQSGEYWEVTTVDYGYFVLTYTVASIPLSGKLRCVAVFMGD